MENLGAKSCGTCKHFEPSSEWRRGWCRNTLLFAPSQSHMVQSEELDCSRGAHSFWEPATPRPQMNAGQQDVKLPTFENPLKLFTPAFAGAPQGASGMNGGHMMFASSGSGSGGGGFDDDDYGFDDDYDFEADAPQDEPTGQRPQSNRTRRSAGRANASGGRSRTASVQPGERYWTDYLRIALPVIGIILMLGLLWIWASSLLGDDTDSVDDPGEDEIGLVTTQTPDPNAVNTEPNVASTPGAPTGNTNAGEIPISNQGQGESTPSGEAPPVFNPTSTEAPGDNQAGEETTTEEEPADEEPPAQTGEIAIDTRVRITEDNVNIRSSASTVDEPIGVAMAGDEAIVASGPEEAEDYIWWELVFDDGSGGFVVQEFLEVIP